MRKRKQNEAESLAAIEAAPLPAVRPKSISRLLSTPEYSTLAYEVYRRRGSQTYFYHVVAWQQTHWWELQEWINQAQYELERLFGPVVRLQSTQKQVHSGKVYVLGFFEIGPISPNVSPIKVGAAWRRFLESIEE